MLTASRKNGAQLDEMVPVSEVYTLVEQARQAVDCSSKSRGGEHDPRG